MLIICDFYKKANIVKELSYCYNSGLVVFCVGFCLFSVVLCVCFSAPSDRRSKHREI